MELCVGIAKIRKYAASESGDTVEVVESRFRLVDSQDRCGNLAYIAKKGTVNLFWKEWKS